MTQSKRLSNGNIWLASLFAASAIFLGYNALGIWPAFLFTFGYLGGLFLWLAVPTRASFGQIRIAYLLCLVLFIVHKQEERKMNFFPALSDLTGVPVPDASSAAALALYGIAATWLLIPILVWKKKPLGYYLAWTFFASMGVTELAHFVLPLFKNGPYGYFPGMWSVWGLAPAGWYGMWCLSRNKGL